MAVKGHINILRAGGNHQLCTGQHQIFDDLIDFGHAGFEKLEILLFAPQEGLGCGILMIAHLFLSSMPRPRRTRVVTTFGGGSLNSSQYDADKRSALAPSAASRA